MSTLRPGHEHAVNGGKGIMPVEPSKILAVRIGRAGDMVMITPALDALLEAYPNAEIHLLTGPEGIRVLQGFHPRLTRYLTYPKNLPQHIWDRRRLLRQVVATQYSHAYVFEADPRYHNRLKNSAHSVHLLHCGLPMLHYCERCLSLVEESVTKTVHRGWVRLPVQAEGRRRTLLQLREHGFQEGACLIGFHATSSSDRAPMFRKRNVRRHRSWPAESFLQLARLLHEHAAVRQYHLQIVMDALPEEVDRVEAIVKESNGAIRLMAGTPDFERYKAMLEKMALLVTPDTGPMHIAAAVGTPLVALFSRKSPEECVPYVSAEKYAILRAENRSKPVLGLAGITPESVFRACLRFLPPAGKGFVTAD